MGEMSGSLLEGTTGIAGIRARSDAPRALSVEESARPLMPLGEKAPPAPEGVGPRALSQWNVLQRMSAEEWAQMMQVLPGRIGARARHGGNARRFVEAVLWVAQTGAYWSDLPRGYGPWHGIYVRFIRWAQDETPWPSRQTFCVRLSCSAPTASGFAASRDCMELRKRSRSRRCASTLAVMSTMTT